MLLGALAFTAGCGSDDNSSSDSGSSTGSSGSSGKVVNVDMGTEPWIGYGPWAIAKAKGFDKANGVNIKLVNFTTDADREQAFASGKTNMSNIPTHAIAKLLASKTTPFETVLFEDISMTADAMLAPADVTDIHQLEGKKVAYEEGTTSDLLLRYALKKAGLPYSAIKPVPIAAADAGSALVAGRVEIAVTYEPYLTAAMKADKGLHRLYAGSALPGLLSDSLIVSKEFSSANPEAVTGVIKAWQQSIDYLRSNPDDGQAIIAKQVGAPVEDLKTSFSGDKIVNATESVAFMKDKLPALLTTIDGILKEQGALKTNVDAQGSVNTSYAEKAVAK
jgi:NitT/TauT family transport system substrate-binding protein